MKNQILFGDGKICEVENILQELSAQKVLLVTGRGSFSSCGAEAALKPILKGYTTERFYDFRANPQFEDIEKGLSLARQMNPDVILAVGGGSPLDLAKIIAIGARSDQSVRDLVVEQNFDEALKVPVVAIPTTSGTGSEVTRFAVLYDGDQKQSTDHPQMIPEYVVLDPELTYSMSPKITAETGLDALCQAIEAFWSCHSTEESRKYSAKAIRLAWEALPDAVLNPTPESRRAMCEASLLAGKAINIAKTTACHAISYVITIHWRVPHGHAVALTLAPMLVHNAGCTANDVIDSRGVDHVLTMMRTIYELLGCEDDKSLVSKVENFIRSLGLETNLNELGITAASDRELIASSVNQERLANNPRALSKKQILDFLFFRKPEL